MTVLETICERSAAIGLGFLVAGGHAVMAHGYARTTFDLDLIIRRTDRDGWLSLLQSLGFSVHHERPTFLQLNPSSDQRWPVDLMFVNDVTFQKLMADALVAPVGKSKTKIVSLRHLIALKCHSIRHGHPGRVVKDTDDLIRVIEANSVKVEDRNIREIILKHGTHELYKQIKQITGARE